MYKYKEEQESKSFVPGKHQKNIYSRASENSYDQTEENTASEDKEQHPPNFWKWLKRAFRRKKNQCWDGESGKGNKKFRHKKVLLLPQLEITRKKMATEHEEETFHIDIRYKVNTNRPENRQQALTEVKQRVRNDYRVLLSNHPDIRKKLNK